MPSDPSVRKQIKDAVLVALAAEGAPCQVEGVRTDPVQADVETPRIVAMFATDTSTEGEDTNSDRAHAFALDVFVIVASVEEDFDGDAIKDIDDIADPITVWVEQQVWKDRTLGGLISNLRGPELSWIRNAAEFTQLGVNMRFTMTYNTAWGDPTQAA